MTPTFAMGRSQSGTTYNANEQTIRTYTPITTQKRPEELVSHFQHKKTSITYGGINN